MGCGSAFGCRRRFALAGCGTTVALLLCYVESILREQRVFATMWKYSMYVNSTTAHRSPDASSSLASVPWTDSKTSSASISFSTTLPLLELDFPVNALDLERSVFYGDLCGMEPFARKLRMGQNVTILIIGSSMTVGIGISKNYEKYRYSSILQTYLRKMLRPGGGAHFHVHNIALGACATTCWLNEVYSVSRRFPEPDLVIAEMIMDPLVSADRKEFKDLLLQFFAFKMPLLFMTGFVADLGGAGPENYFSTATYQQEDLRAAQIPFFSYRDLVWPIKAKPPKDLLSRYWQNVENVDPVRHPGELTHKEIAKGLGATIHSILRKCEKLQAVCDLGAYYSKQLFGLNVSEVKRCITPKTSLRSEGVDHRRFKPVMKPNATIWSYRSDARDKYGWIGEVKFMGYPKIRELGISFDVVVGLKRRIDISFLRTYQNIGGVRVTLRRLDGLAQGPVNQHLDGSVYRWIDGLWNMKASAPASITMFAKPGHVRMEFTLLPILMYCHSKGKGEKPPVEFRKLMASKDSHAWCDHLDKRAQKFKLLSITTC